MFEMTHKGAWFKWSALGPADKKVAAVSLTCWALVGALLGLSVPSGAHIPQWLGAAYPWMMLAGFGFALVGAVTWWLFSRRQDDLFNRIQNHAVGLGCAWSIGAAAGWSWLSLGGWVDPLPTPAWIILAYLLVCGFWFRAARKWA